MENQEQQAYEQQRAGLRFLREKRGAEAAEAFSRAAALHPPDAALLANWGYACALMGDREGAADRFAEAARREPERAALHNNLAMALADLGDYPGALAACMDALKLERGNPAFHHTLGHIHHRMGRLDQAIQEYRLALRGAPRALSIHFDLARAFTEQGSELAPDAWRFFLRLASRRPDEADRCRLAREALRRLSETARPEA